MTFGNAGQLCSLKLRMATTDDISELLATLKEAFKDHERLEPPSTVPQETPESICQRLSHGYAIVALLDEAIVGCVFCEVDDIRLCLHRLGVLPTFCRQGIGHALMAYVEKLAAKLNCYRLRLGVRVELPDVCVFYKKLGYNRLGRFERPGCPNVSYVLLEKDISDITFTR